MSSRAYRLKTKEDAIAGVRRIAGGRAEKALERLRGAGSGELAPAVHGARKDLKKLRGLLRLVRDEFGGKAFKAENRCYREAGRLLSGSRDAEVKLETLLALQHRFEDLPRDAGERWQGVLETERDELVAAMRNRSEGRIDHAIEAIEAGRDAIGRWPLQTEAWALAGPGLSRSYGDGREVMKRVLSAPSTGNIHDWRKRVKDLWYQLRIVREAWPGPLGETIDQAHKLTDLLGDHHDLAMLAEDLRARDLGARGAFETAIETRQAELLKAAIEIGRRLYAEKPKAFRRRIERYWLAWRET